MGFCTVRCKVIVFFLTFVILKPEPMKQSLFFSIAASLLLLAGCSGNKAADPSMYRAQWRILETEDEHFYLDEQSYHWPMQGIGLSDEVLKKIYHDNAVRLLDARKK